MQIDRTAVVATHYNRAFCALECTDCTGMCLPLFMMLTREEQDEMYHRYKAAEADRFH